MFQHVKFKVRRGACIASFSQASLLVWPKGLVLLRQMSCKTHANCYLMIALGIDLRDTKACHCRSPIATHPYIS